MFHEVPAPRQELPSQELPSQRSGYRSMISITPCAKEEGGQLDRLLIVS
jgi:hypothetical protein